MNEGKFGGEIPEEQTTTPEKENLSNSLSLEAETITGVRELVGKSFSSEKIEVPQEKVDSFLEATGDINPIHFNQQEIEKSILKDENSNESVIPGFLTLSLCANEKVLYEALKISEPHEIVSLGLKDVKFLSPVPLNSELVYKYKMKSAEDKNVKSRSAVQVEWEIVASVSGKEKETTCMKASWTVLYVRLPDEK